MEWICAQLKGYRTQKRVVCLIGKVEYFDTLGALLADRPIIRLVRAWIAAACFSIVNGVKLASID